MGARHPCSSSPDRRCRVAGRSGLRDEHANLTLERTAEEPELGWFPWGDADGSGHPALQEFQDDRTLGERVADAVARFGGSWPFIFLFTGLILGWMALNSLVLTDWLRQRPFDPYPYIALNLVLSAIAGIQAPIIMTSQNRAAARDEALARHHYAETKKMDHLLDRNTELTAEVRQLTGQIHDLTSEVRAQLVGPQRSDPRVRRAKP
ncbi:MAG: DUF1003 domain-containing protein [Actinobacteria bacterium]|nr:DUF1003 domain-containing protein [Actinomycetota bacterium]